MSRWTRRAAHQQVSAQEGSPESDQSRDDQPSMAPRAKLTGAQLQERYEQAAAARRSARAQRDAQRPPGRRLRITLGALILVGVLGAMAQNTSAANTQREQEQQIDTLTQQVRELQHGQSSADQDSTDDAGDEALVTARVDIDTAAAKVADLQNNYRAVLSTRAKALTKGGGSDTPSTLQPLVDHRKQLAKHFAESTFVVDDQVAYATKIKPGYEGGQDMVDGYVDPRYPWVLPINAFASSNASACDWTVLSAMPDISGDPGSLGSATWACSTASKGGSSGGVVAWASADFDTQSKTFTNLQVTGTSLRADLGVDAVGTRSSAAKTKGAG